ncbi:hypothetical protein D5125_14710 [Magnetovirga frankeli]|uniref:hypothetical protein n=1 Tax=Magnetovirga frankeli TaxID=947516 RepID=UPI0012940D5E|nr:hypothetical protein D5125_14710 [gamma proteobacterium SS-5]
MILVTDSSALVALAACDSVALLQAKRMGLVSHIAPRMRQITESPIFISEGLVATVLELAGELDQLP